MAVKVYQQILRGFRTSDRGIRYRVLKGTVVDDLRRKAAQLVEGRVDVPVAQRQAETRRTFLREGVKAMLVAVTKAPVPRPEAPEPPAAKEGETPPPPPPPPSEPLLDDAALWEELSIGKLTMPGPFHYELDEETDQGLFTAVDDSFLCSLFAANHEPNFVVADDIVKKERLVSKV